ncbi:DEK carboxy-terminal domain protein [Fagus crenata]
MAELKKLSPPAYEYLSKIPVATWSRSKFTKNPKSDLIVNNLSECFNSYILDARDKLILTMLDTIRRKLMRRFQVNRASIAKMSGKLCPKIQVKVDKAGVKASECLLMYAGEEKYEGKKKSRGAAGAGTAGAGGARTAGIAAEGAGTSAGTAGAGGAGTAGTGAGGAGTARGVVGTAAGGAGTAGGVAGIAGTTASAGGSASKKAKVIVPTVEKAMTRIAAKKQKKQ